MRFEEKFAGENGGKIREATRSTISLKFKRRKLLEKGHRGGGTQCASAEMGHQSMAQVSNRAGDGRKERKVELTSSLLFLGAWQP